MIMLQIQAREAEADGFIWESYSVLVVSSLELSLSLVISSAATVPHSIIHIAYILAYSNKIIGVILHQLNRIMIYSLLSFHNAQPYFINGFMLKCVCYWPRFMNLFSIVYNQPGNFRSSRIALIIWPVKCSGYASIVAFLIIL